MRTSNFSQDLECYQPWQAGVMGLIVDNNQVVHDMDEATLTELAESARKHHTYKVGHI